MKPSAFPAGAVLGLTLALAGCAATETPRHDASFGQAVLSARAQQTLNPDAPSKPQAPAGIDGRAARAAMEHYHQTFRAPPPSFNVINIGGGLGNGQ